MWYHLLLHVLSSFLQYFSKTVDQYHLRTMSAWTLSFIFIISIIHHLRTETITCQKGNNCKCSTSVSGEACTLDCGGIDRCKAATLTCRTGDECRILCNAKSSCSEATMNAQTATDTTVMCGAEDSCKSKTKLYCGTGRCELWCFNSGTSCEDMATIDISTADSWACMGNECPNNAPPPHSASPTLSPSVPSFPPSRSPSPAPTKSPTPAPTSPTLQPSESPTPAPTSNPTNAPTTSPTAA
eukprot:1070019_1